MICRQENKYKNIIYIQYRQYSNCRYYARVLYNNLTDERFRKHREEFLKKKKGHNCIARNEEDLRSFWGPVQFDYRVGTWLILGG